MKQFFLVCFVVFLVYFNAANARPNVDYYNNGRCVNMWDEGCINGQLPGAGADDDYLGGGFNPGKRSLYELLAKLQKKHPYY